MQLDYTLRRLSEASVRYMGRKRERFVALTAKMEAMSPLKVLSRGYSMTKNAEGKLVKSVNDVSANEEVTVLLSDGELRAQIEEVIR